MAQDIFNNAANEGLIALTKLKNKYGRDFVNNTDYFDKLDVNNITLYDMATDLHVMTKTENGDYISEPMNVALSRIKATTSIAACTKPDGIGLTEAEYAMRAFWFDSLNSDMGVHIYVNTETDANKPKKLEAKFIDLSLKMKAPEGENEQPKYEQKAVLEKSLENIGLNKLNAAKAAGRHCDSKGWLNFKKFFSRQATKQKLQREYDDYQALKVTVAQDEVKYRAAAQAKCAAYSSASPDEIAAIERETFERNNREVAKYHKTEKAANIALAAKIIAKCADQLPNYESMHMHYVNALVADEGFNEHTMGQTQSILGNEKEEAALISYISPNKELGRLADIITAANDSFEEYGAINFDMPEPENDEIGNNAPDLLMDTRKKELKFIAGKLANTIADTHKIKSSADVPPDIEREVMLTLIMNSKIFKQHTDNLPENKLGSVLENEQFLKDITSDKTEAIIRAASNKIGAAFNSFNQVTAEDIDFYIKDSYYTAQDFKIMPNGNTDKYSYNEYFIPDGSSKYRNKEVTLALALLGTGKTGVSNIFSPNAVKIIWQNDVLQKYAHDLPENEIMSLLNNEDFKSEMLSYENTLIMRSAFEKAKALPGENVTLADTRAVLREATSIVNKDKETEAASFIAEGIMDALAINNNNNISPERKDAARDAISSRKVIKSFVVGKSVEDIKSMQKDPKQQQAYQAFINTVIMGFNKSTSNGKAALPKPIADKPKDIDPKDKENDNKAKDIAPKDNENDNKAKDIAPKDNENDNKAEDVAPKDNENDNKAKAVAPKKKLKQKVLY